MKPSQGFLVQLYINQNKRIMQLGGKPKNVKLKVDLTRYDSRLTVGQEGTTIPNRKIGMYGSYDHFVAVKFNCGAVLDIAIKSLEFDGEYINS
jgi:hypothetical protein